MRQNHVDVGPGGGKGRGSPSPGQTSEPGHQRMTCEARKRIIAGNLMGGLTAFIVSVY